MAKIKGTNIAAPIAPFTDEDSYPTHDSKYGKGGLKEVDTLVERDAIPADLRSRGMMVFVIEDSNNYQLKTGITNSDWVVLESGTGGGMITINQQFNSTDLVANGEGGFSWTWTHNLGKKPIIRVFDTSMEQKEHITDVVQVSDNAARIDFANLMSGHILASY
jgi:hypothetical protein